MIGRYEVLAFPSPRHCRCLQMSLQKSWGCLSVRSMLLVTEQALGFSGFSRGTGLPFNLANGAQKEGVQQWDRCSGWETEHPCGLLLVYLPETLVKPMLQLVLEYLLRWGTHCLLKSPIPLELFVGQLFFFFLFLKFIYLFERERERDSVCACEWGRGRERAHAWERERERERERELC